MKKYAFRLETVRRVRRTQETLAKHALAQANADVRRAVAAVEARTSEYENQLASMSQGSNAVDAFMRQRYFSDLAAQAIEVAKLDQQNADDHAAQRRLEWSDAATKVKALDRLDERRLQEFRIEHDREITNEVDDIVIAAASRSRERSTPMRGES